MKYVSHEYSEHSDGGIRFRLDIQVERNGERHWIAYTTNDEGSGLFYHNGRGDRSQALGTGQFYAGSLRQFKLETASILKSRKLAEVGHEG